MQATLESELTYLRDVPPDPGASIPLLDGMTWLRVPLPFVLNHVNCWLLEDAKGRITLIDTGSDKPETRALWESVLDTLPRTKSVERLVCTHGHPDHVGLAGWLVEKLGVPLHMTLAEWLAPQVWREEGMHPLREEPKAFFRSHGVPDKAIEAMDHERSRASFRNYPMPASFVRMRDKEIVRFGGRRWQVLVNGGHADEHASFWCKDEGILIAGDQILSKISPVVGVFPSQPLSNPLADYLASLKRLRKLPEETIVLPSHGLPFRGLRTRVDQLASHHEKRLDTLWNLMAKPANGVELAHGLFPKAMASKGHLTMALAETLAHAHHLVATRRAKRTVSKSGAITFKRT